MTAKSHVYDHPQYLVNQEHCVGEVGGGATTVYGKFHNYTAFKLEAVHARVTTAGTATAHVFDVYKGTTSIASFALSTSAAGVTSSIAIGSDFTSLEALEVKSGADVVGKAVISYELRPIPGGTVNVS